MKEKEIDKQVFAGNNFNILRFIAASTVLYQHSYPLYGSSSGSYFAGIVNAVAVFFVISGFLITKSWQNRLDIPRYLKSRFFRIVPGLFVCLLFTILVIGPICTSFSLKEYFSERETYRYFLRNITFNARFFLPGVFDDNPYQRAVNGSLWTLPIEVFCYLGVVGFGLLNIFRKKHILPIITVLIIACYFCILRNPDPSFLHYVPKFLKARYSLLYVGHFLVGANFFLYYKEIKPQLKQSYALLALGLYLYPNSNEYLKIITQFIAFPYLVIYLAFCINFKFSFLRNFGNKYDLSYGMYIYAFVVQQTIMHFFASKITLPMFFISAYFITSILAFLSFVIVEKPFLRLKHYEIKFSIQEWKNNIWKQINKIKNENHN
jgi:peptidoglycan/LPS O-acetylase OafA/YrhL